MKKILAVFILLTILIFSFSACTKNSNDTSNQNGLLTLSKQSLDMVKGDIDSVTANLTVDGQVVTDVAFSFTLASNYPSGVVEFSHNGNVFTVVALKAGNVKINCVAVYKEKEYSSTISIFTVNERVDLNDVVYIEYGAGDVFYLPTSISGVVMDVKYQGESIFNGYVQKTRSVIVNALNIPLGVLPEKLSVYAMGKEYRINAEYIGMIVNDADEFFAIQDIAYELGDKDPEAPTLEGIFYLGNDIVIPNNKVYTTKYRTNDFKGGFRGVIDGRGYKVNGLTIGDGQYLFHALLGNGGLKNIAFVNSVKSGTGGFLCYMRDSELTNVYFHFKRVEAVNGTYLIQKENHGISKSMKNILVVVDNVVDLTGTSNAKLSMGTIRWECLRPNEPQYCRATNCAFICANNFNGVSVSGLSTYPYPNDQYLVKTIPCTENINSLSETQSNWDTNYWIVTNGIPEFKFS